MTFKKRVEATSKKAHRRFAVGAAVLLAVCLMFVGAGSANVVWTIDTNGVNTTTASTVDDLKAALSQIEDSSAPNCDYLIKLIAGTYDLSAESSDKIKIIQNALNNVTIVGLGIDQTIIKGGFNISSGTGTYDDSTTLTIKDITFDARESTGLMGGGVIEFIFDTSSGTRYLHNIRIDSVKIIGNHINSGIAGIRSNHGNGGVSGLTLMNVQISDFFSPVIGYLHDDVTISGCTFTNCDEGVNFNSDDLKSLIITDSEISTNKYAVRIGPSNGNFAQGLTINFVGNIFDGGNSNDLATIIFRGNISTPENVKINGNAILGKANKFMCDATSSSYNLNSAPFDLSGNYWGDGDKPTEDEMGGIIFDEGDNFLTVNPFAPPQPVEPTTPSSSSSSVQSEPGVYYNYPRHAEDGGLVEFGTSKVVKSVTLPEGSNGKVNLNIDSTKYWPLELDSEFRFDISVDNYGGGTSYIIFEIDEPKLTALDITAADVGVYHNVNGEWMKLSVTYVIENGMVIYTAETDSFSPFKLVIEEGAATPKDEEVTPFEPVVDEPVDLVIPNDSQEELPPIDPVEPTEPESPTPLLAVLAGLGAAVVLRRK